jgi:hypothetical protein
MNHRIARDPAVKSGRTELPGHAGDGSGKKGIRAWLTSS